MPRLHVPVGTRVEPAVAPPGVRSRSVCSTYASPQALINALIKLYKDNATTLTPDPIHSEFYNSHPPDRFEIEPIAQGSSAGDGRLNTALSASAPAMKRICAASTPLQAAHYATCCGPRGYACEVRRASLVRAPSAISPWQEWRTARSLHNDLGRGDARPAWNQLVLSPSLSVNSGCARLPGDIADGPYSEARRTSQANPAARSTLA